MRMSIPIGLLLAASLSACQTTTVDVDGYTRLEGGVGRGALGVSGPDTLGCTAFPSDCDE